MATAVQQHIQEGCHQWRRLVPVEGGAAALLCQPLTLVWVWGIDWEAKLESCRPALPSGSL